MLRGNEIVNKLLKNRSFLDFVVPLNYIIISDFALSRFSRPRSLQTEEKWEDPSKTAEFLGSAEEWHHVRDGRRQVYLTRRVRSVQRVQPRPSIQPIIISPRFAGFETCDKVRRLFLFPISKQNKNLGFPHVKSGNPDTSRYFALSGRSAVVSDYTANFSQTKK